MVLILEERFGMEIIKKISIGSLLALFLMVCGCAAEEGPVFTDIEIEEISFSTDIQPIFTANCITCHNESHYTGLNLQEGFSYNLLVNTSSTNYSPNLRIAPFDLENSVLWHKINDDGVFGGIMPQIGGPLSNFELEKIAAWIELGALDN